MQSDPTQTTDEISFDPPPTAFILSEANGQEIMKMESGPPPLPAESPLSWYEIVDGLANLWLLLVSLAWILKLNDPAYGAVVILCDWVVHMGEPNA